MDSGKGERRKQKNSRKAKTGKKARKINCTGQWGEELGKGGRGGF